MQRLVLTIKDGVVLGPQDDLLQGLGHMQVRRASNLEFNETTQHWEVFIDGARKFDDPSRRVCLDWEREYLNDQERQRLALAAW